MNRRTCNWRYFSSVIYYSKCRSELDFRLPFLPAIIVVARKILSQTALLTTYIEHEKNPKSSQAFIFFMENRSSSQFTITSLITMNKFSHFIRSGLFAEHIHTADTLLNTHPAESFIFIRFSSAAQSKVFLHFPSRWFFSPNPAEPWGSSGESESFACNLPTKRGGWLANFVCSHFMLSWTDFSPYWTNREWLMLFSPDKLNGWLIDTIWLINPQDVAKKKFAFS